MAKSIKQLIQDEHRRNAGYHRQGQSNKWIKGVSSHAVGGAAMKQRRIKSNLFGAQFHLVGSKPAPRGSLTTAWLGPKGSAKGKSAQSHANWSGGYRAHLRKAASGGSGSRSEAARKAWVTRRGH